MMAKQDDHCVSGGVMAQLSENAKELLQRPIHAWITTLRPDGTPHNTVVWVDVEDDEVIVNTAIGRAKERHLRRDPRTAVSVLDPDDPFHYVSVSGTARLETEGADSVIDRLAEKYLGVDVYPYRQPGERRITVRITPQEIIYSAGG
jgi:PPOX class probable F420-dependent enzyme